MSFGLAEYSGETAYSAYLTTTTGHPGVTFVAATGDNGSPGTWPACSANVAAVGGTSLYVSGLNYVSESGWSGSGGGISQYITQPSWQNGVVTQSTTKRTIPDVSLTADPNTGVPIYNTYDFAGSPWAQYGGTSLACPMWAGLLAIAAQGRALAGLTALDGATQTLPGLYQLGADNFRDITTGNNGFAAGPGYDLVTGRGTPIASMLINNLIGVGSISGMLYEDRNGTGARDAGDMPVAGATVFLDSNDNGVLDLGVVTSAASTDVPKNINYGTTGVTSNLTVSGISGPITDVNVTVSISHGRMSDLTVYLIGPDNTTVALFAGLSGSNMTNAVFDDQAAGDIASGSAPYSGTFRPSPGLLAAFNGKAGSAVNGTWKLKVVDGVVSQSGTITGWSITLTSGAERATITNSDGTYSLDGVVYGSQKVRVSATEYVPVAPVTGRELTVGGNIAGQDFSISLLNSISGVVFLDANHNNVLDAGETGLAGCVVYVDANGNGAREADEVWQMTAASGSYSLAGLVGGANQVRIEAPSGYLTTLPSGGMYLVNLASGTAVNGRNFGLAEGGSVMGSVFIDKNGNGQFDTDEEGLSGWAVYLDINSDEVWNPEEPSRQTGVGGAYAFSALAPGTYSVRVVAQEGFVASGLSGSQRSVLVSWGAVANGIDFGQQAIVVDQSPPSGTIQPVHPDLVSGLVETVDMVFSEPVFGLDSTSLSLTRDGFSVPMPGVVIGTVDQTHFTVGNLAAFTELPGRYVLAINGTGIVDGAGNPLSGMPTQTWHNTMLGGTEEADHVTISLNAADPTLADVVVEGGAAFQFRPGNLPFLQARLGDGDDILTVDFSGGNPLPTGGVFFDGGPGENLLRTRSPAGSDVIRAESGRLLFNGTAIELVDVGSVVLEAEDGLDSLTVAAGTTLRLGLLPHGALWVGQLNIEATATLDLGNNSLVLSSGGSFALAAIVQAIVNGRDGLPGPKLVGTSAAARPTALAPLDNRTTRLETWNGLPLGGAFDQIIVKRTYAGDTNMDGQVTQLDLFNVVANQGKANAGWPAGDVNLDGLVDLSDLQMVLGNMGAGAGGIGNERL